MHQNIQMQNRIKSIPYLHHKTLSFATQQEVLNGKKLGYFWPGYFTYGIALKK